MEQGECLGGAIYGDGSYLQRNPTWHLEDSAWKARQVASILTDNSVMPSSVVDIGCGAGGVLIELRRSFPDTTMVGWDVSTDVAAVWPAGTLQVELNQGDFRSDERRYDVALLLDVLEHVPDYMGLSRDVTAVADLVVFHIPLDMNVSSVIRKRYLHVRALVGHLHYFTYESALALLSDTGYKVLDARLTKGAKELTSAQRPVTRVANVVRSVAELFGTRHAATILGGYSLLVLAEPETQCRQLGSHDKVSL